MHPYKIFTWKIDQALVAPRLGIDVHQKWPYAPYHQMIFALQYAARDLALYLCLAALTLMILGDDLSLGRLALLAGLFALPYWALMAGGVPLPDSVLPAQFAEAQVKALPVLALLPLLLAVLVQRGQSRIGSALVVLLMALLLLGHPLLALLPEEPKRKAIESTARMGLVGYPVALAWFAAMRAFFRRWLNKRRERLAQQAQREKNEGEEAGNV